MVKLDSFEIALLVVTVFLFLLNFFAAIKRPKHGFWVFVDCLYYPLAAIGIALLFHNNAGKREEIELVQQKEVITQTLVELSSTKPEVDLDSGARLFDSSLKLILNISGMTKICEGLPQSSNCRASLALAPAVNKFLDVAQNYDGALSAMHLSKTCSAANSMLLEIDKSSGVFSPASRLLIEKYKILTQRGLGWAAQYEIVRASEALKSEALRELETVERDTFDGSRSQADVMAVYRSEINYIALILNSLLPCVATQQGKLKEFEVWNNKIVSNETSVAEKEAKIKIAKERQDPFFQQLQISLWPFILILALSLKFGKGVAAVCVWWRARSETKKTEVKTNTKAPPEENAPVAPITNG
jgi:hypothetical protein